MQQAGRFRLVCQKNRPQNGNSSTFVISIVQKVVIIEGSICTNRPYNDKRG